MTLMKRSSRAKGMTEGLLQTGTKRGTSEGQCRIKIRLQKTLTILHMKSSGSSILTKVKIISKRAWLAANFQTATKKCSSLCSKLWRASSWTMFIWSESKGQGLEGIALLMTSSFRSLSCLGSTEKSPTQTANFTSKISAVQLDLFWWFGKKWH